MLLAQFQRRLVVVDVMVLVIVEVVMMEVVVVAMVVVVSEIKSVVHRPYQMVVN